MLQFEYHLEQNIFQLHRDLRGNKYKHGQYKSFYITDPKRRHIHKAIVRDRVVHHVYTKLFIQFSIQLLSQLLFPVDLVKVLIKASCGLQKLLEKSVKTIQSRVLY